MALCDKRLIVLEGGHVCHDLGMDLVFISSGAGLGFLDGSMGHQGTIIDPASEAICLAQDKLLMEARSSNMLTDAVLTSQFNSVLPEQRVDGLVLMGQLEGLVLSHVRQDGLGMLTYLLFKASTTY